MQKQLGRCPVCSKAVLVDVSEGKRGVVTLHGCRSRECVYPGCRVKEPLDRMVQFASGEWYCPNHGLLLAAKDLVSLYRAEGGADWTAISEIIGEVLPDLAANIEARNRS